MLTDRSQAPGALNATPSDLRPGTTTPYFVFALLGLQPRFKSVPVKLLDAIIAVLGTAGRVVPALADKAELARIGRYYATESMLVLDPATGRYDAAATPSTGSQTLFDFYADVVQGGAAPERGDHAVF